MKTKSDILAQWKCHQKPLLLTSCDETYYNSYAGSLIASALAHGECLHIHVINPSQETAIELGMLNKKLFANNGLSYSIEFIDLSDWSDTRRKVYYASARFRVADRYLRYRSYRFNEHDVYVIYIDVDSIVNKDIDWDSVLIHQPALGIYDRRDENLGSNDRERLGMKVLANGFSREYCFFMDVYEYIEEKNFEYWFLDQEAIYEVWTKYYPQTFWTNVRNTKLIDFEFHPDTFIWTGKGPRKWTNQTYIKVSEHWKNIYYEMLDREVETSAEIENLKELLQSKSPWEHGKD